MTRIAARWHADAESLTHVRDGTNSVYAVRVAGTRYYLRVTNTRHRTRAQLEAELDFVEYLGSRGISVARAHRSASGERIESFPAEPARHAILFAAVRGRHFEFFSSDIDRRLFDRWGSAMGAMHAASHAFVPTGPRRPSWDAQDSTTFDRSGIPGSEMEAWHEHECLTQGLESVPRTPATWGLIHADFERTNFVIDGRGTVHIYDFDDACYHWYAADIANALWAFRNAPPCDRAHFLEWFLEGYRRQYTIAPNVREQLAGFIRVRTLSLFVNRLRSARDTEWVRRTRTTFGKPFAW